MNKGDIISGEHRSFPDAQTGAQIVQLTDHPSINHSLFFLNSSFRPRTQPPALQVAFVTFRDGLAQLCLFDFASRSARCLSDDAGLQSFSPAFSGDGQHLYYTTVGGDIQQVDIETLETRSLLTLADTSLGECNVSHDDRYLVTAAKGKNRHGLLVVDLQERTHKVIFETEQQILHPQFDPNNANRIEYAVHPIPRLWFIQRDGSNNRCPYYNQWHEFIVHESFLGQTGDMICAIWPYRLGRFNTDRRQMGCIADINAWHMSSNRDGTKIVTDTNHPDRGLLLIDPDTGAQRVLCHPQASNHGTQWHYDHPATADAWLAGPSAEADRRVLSWMEMKVDTVYGPQWTHPHPAFDDSATHVVYTSDVSGQPQVYVVEVPVDR